jgi:hypothetical protein
MSSTGKHIIVPDEASFEGEDNSKLLACFLVVAAAARNYSDSPSAAGHGAELLIALSVGSFSAAPPRLIFLGLE